MHRNDNNRENAIYMYDFHYFIAVKLMIALSKYFWKMSGYRVGNGWMEKPEKPDEICPHSDGQTKAGQTERDKPGIIRVICMTEPACSIYR